MEKRLSLCMIVKDEERFIRNCLDSIKHVVDEMIIVDTGSSDQTLSICQSYGAKIIEVPWTDSFADVRNRSLQEATGDWILWMDADEKLDEDNGIHIRDILTEEEAHIGLVKLVNYIGDGAPRSENSYVVGHHRLLRNHVGFQFRGSIHEQLNVQEVLGSQFHVREVPATLHHFGYLNQIVETRSKSERNLQLLEREKDKPDYNPWVDYHIASELYRLENYTDAFDVVNTSLRRFIEGNQLPPSLCYKLKYEIMLAAGSYNEAWPSIEKAIALYPDYVDLHFYKGIILFLKEKYSTALTSFQQCIELGESNLKHLTLRGVGTFHPLYYIGKCHENLGDWEEAIQAYEKCLQLHPTHSFASSALESLLKQHELQKESHQLDQNRVQEQQDQELDQIVQEEEHMREQPETTNEGEEPSMAGSITISLCMIVRDEEIALDRCLESVKGIPDEIIIVDTGSKDKTKQVAKKHKAKVYDFEWIDHFAAARNYAFIQATKEYILWLDADDVIESKDRTLFLQLKRTLSRDVDSVTMPYVLMVDAEGNVTSSLRRNRLVRRNAGFQWHGPVHEYLLVGGHIIHSDVSITHKKDKKYTDRNLRIYETRLAAGEEFTPRDLYYFGNELRDHGRYEEAADQYTKFLNSGQGWIEDNIQACRKMADCYNKLEMKTERFMALFRSFEYDKPRAEICCEIGSVWMDTGHYKQAMYWFEQAIQLPPDSDQMSVVEPSTWTWVPHLQLCVCNDRLGDSQKACYHNEVALSFHPTHSSMLYNREYFQKKLGESYSECCIDTYKS